MGSRNKTIHSVRHKKAIDEGSRIESPQDRKHEFGCLAYYSNYVPQANIHFLKKKAQAGNDLLNILPKSSHARKKHHRHHITVNPTLTRYFINSLLILYLLSKDINEYVPTNFLQGVFDHL